MLGDIKHPLKILSATKIVLAGGGNRTCIHISVLCNIFQFYFLTSVKHLSSGEKCLHKKFIIYSERKDLIQEHFFHGNPAIKIPSSRGPIINPCLNFNFRTTGYISDSL